MFEDITFFLIWLMLPIIWLYLLKVAELSLLQVTIPGITVLFILVTQYVGLPVLFFQLNDYRFLSGVNDKVVMLEVATYAAVSISIMLFGFIVANKMFGALVWEEKHNIFYQKNLLNGNWLMMVLLLMLFLICSAVLLLYLSKVGFHNIALIEVFSHKNNLSSAALRSAMGNSFDGKYHRYNLFMNKLMLFTAFAFFAQYLTRKNFLNGLIFLCVFLVTTFSMIMATEKGPMVNFIIGLFFVYILICKRGFISIKMGFYVVLIILSVAVVFYIFFMNTADILSAISNTVSRVFTGTIQPVYHYIEFFPENHDYLFGKSFPNPSNIFPFEQYPLAKEIAAWHSPENAQKGIVGSMPAVYWGEMYANFGVPGVIIPPFFVGFILYYINTLLFKLQNNVLVISLFVWLIMHLKTLSVSSLSSYFVDTYLIGVVLLFFFIAFLSGKLKIKLRSKHLENVMKVDL